MRANLTADTDRIDWDQLAVIFERAPLGKRDPAILREVFKNSGVRCFAWTDRKLIGAGRAITDGVRCAVILDVVVLPEHQGKGVEKQIMAFLIENSKAANVLLYAAPGRESFYQKIGFRRMKTAMARFENPDVQHQLGYID